MRERAFYYRGNRRRLEPPRLDPGRNTRPSFGRLAERDFDAANQRNSPINLLDGTKIDYATMIDRVPAVKIA